MNFAQRYAPLYARPGTQWAFEQDGADKSILSTVFDAADSSSPSSTEGCPLLLWFKASPGNGWDGRTVILGNGERREHCPIADFKLLKNVMEVLFDGPVGNIQPAPNLLVRQAFGHQTHDLSLAVCEHR